MGSNGPGFLPEVDRFNILVFAWVPTGRDVAHAKFLALIDVHCACEGGQHQREHFGTVGPPRITIVCESAYGSGIVVVFQKNGVPAVVGEHGGLPFVRYTAKVSDRPGVQSQAYGTGDVVNVHNVEDEYHV